jgi:hypothetical protein
MRTNQKKYIRPTLPDMVVALFTDSRSVRDAIADLNEMGVRGNDVQVAFSAEGKRGHEPIASGQHSVRWKLEHGFTQDMHTRGSHLTESDAKAQKDAGMSFTEVDLQEALANLGVSGERILQLDRETGVEGTMLFVRAQRRSREIQRILEHNCGYIRTDTATERPGYAPEDLSGRAG